MPHQLAPPPSLAVVTLMVLTFIVVSLLFNKVAVSSSAELFAVKQFSPQRLNQLWRSSLWRDGEEFFLLSFAIHVETWRSSSNDATCHQDERQGSSRESPACIVWTAP